MPFFSASNYVRTLFLLFPPWHCFASVNFLVFLWRLKWSEIPFLHHFVPISLWNCNWKDDNNIGKKVYKSNLVSPFSEKKNWNALITTTTNNVINVPSYRFQSILKNRTRTFFCCSRFGLTQNASKQVTNICTEFCDCYKWVSMFRICAPLPFY